MEEYVKVLNYAIPGFLVLIAIEYAISYFKEKKVYRGYDTVSSLSSGLTNTIKDVFGLVFVIFSYDWMTRNFAVYNIESKTWMYIAAFIGLDFAGYWSHRFEHVINIFWNRHIIHHSSEEFNLACALRQPVSGFVAVFGFLYIPMALVGVPTEVIATAAPLHLFAQFWYHTRLINKMGPLEYILVTPSHHRVHHAMNDAYLDKNFSQIFIIWDRLFGTFQKELADVPPVYGVKRPLKTWNPILINFKHLWLLIKDAWRSKNWFDKLRIWFMPTGWRPDDVINKYPVYGIDDVYEYKKYDSGSDPKLILWSWIQLLAHLFLMLYCLNTMAKYPIQMVFIHGAFLMISIFAYTSLMDRGIIGFIAECLKVIVGFIAIYLLGDWYGMDQYFNGATNIIISYLIISLLITSYFTFVSKPEMKVVPS